MSGAGWILRGMRTVLSRLPIDPYIASILGMVALASALPAQGLGMTISSWAGTAAIALMFFLQGAHSHPRPRWQVHGTGGCTPWCWAARSWCSRCWD